MTLIYKINDLESKIPYAQWKALKEEFVEFAKEKKQLETNINEAIEVLKRNSTGNPYLETSDLVRILERGVSND